MLEAKDGEIEITGGGPRFRFRELAVDEFPKVEEPDMSEAVAVDGGAFSAALGQVSVAASTDDARPILTGVFFEHEAGKLRMVATDSYRLAVRDVPAVDADLSGLVPVRALKELGRSVGASDLKVSVGDREASFGSSRGT